MIEFFISLLVAVVVLWAIFALWYGAEMFMLIRATKKQADGLRLSPMRDYDGKRD